MEEVLSLYQQQIKTEAGHRTGSLLTEILLNNLRKQETLVGNVSSLFKWSPTVDKENVCLVINSQKIMLFIYSDINLCMWESGGLNC